jgi:thioredoxin 1
MLRIGQTVAKGEGANMVADLSEQEFDATVARAGRPILVDFWAPWCGPCRMVSPLVEELAEELAGRMDAYKVNVDDNPGLAQRFGVQSIPTLLLIKEGQTAARVVGYRPKAELRRALEDKLPVAN